MSATWPTGPLRPPPPSDEVHVWRAELNRAGWPGPEGLPGGERERAKGMLRPEPSRRWIASRWALRTILCRYLGEDPATIELGLGEHGKPELADRASRLSFNLSHSGALALVAVTAGHEVGVDVERIEPDRDLLALADRGLDAAAAAAVRAAVPRRRASAFYAAWVRHEALLKCLGGPPSAPGGTPSAPGEAPSSPGADPVAVSPLAIDRGYAAAVAVAGLGPVAPHRSWSIGPP